MCVGGGRGGKGGKRSQGVNSNLPGGGVVSEEEEHGGEPGVDLVQAALLVRGLQDGLQMDNVRIDNGMME